MHVIGHQDVGVYRTLVFACLFFQVPQVKLIITVCEKTGLPIMPALNDMPWNSCNRQAGSARQSSSPY